MSNQNVKLKKNHTHQDVKYKQDSVLSVPQEDADWLVNNKIADLQVDQIPESKREGKKA